MKISSNPSQAKLNTNCNRVTEVENFTKSRSEEALGFLNGARTMCNRLTTCADDPIDVEMEFDGVKWRIYEIRGEWIGTHESSFEACYV